jgi:hypothetical protein
LLIVILGNEMNEINPLERRNDSYNVNDRRTSMQAAQFPIITRNDVCVRIDRRRLPDRRVAKIEVDEAHVHEEVFDLLFEKSKAKRF